MKSRKKAFERLYNTTAAAVIAAVYAALSFVGIPVNFFFFRPSEALTVMPALTPAAIPGLSLGCLLANYLAGCAIPDLFFGTLATCLGALGTYLLRRHRILSFLPPVLANTLILPPVLMYVYGAKTAYPLLLLSTFASELVCCVILGYLLRTALERHRFFSASDRP